MSGCVLLGGASTEGAEAGAGNTALHESPGLS